MGGCSKYIIVDINAFAAISGVPLNTLRLGV